jgi:hypothetical protein
MIDPVYAKLESQAARRCLWFVVAVGIVIKIFLILLCSPEDSPLYPRY